MSLSIRKERVQLDRVDGCIASILGLIGDKSEGELDAQITVGREVNDLFGPLRLCLADELQGVKCRSLDADLQCICSAARLC